MGEVSPSSSVTSSLAARRGFNVSPMPVTRQSSPESVRRVPQLDRRSGRSCSPSLSPRDEAVELAAADDSPGTKIQRAATLRRLQQTAPVPGRAGEAALPRPALELRPQPAENLRSTDAQPYSLASQFGSHPHTHINWRR